MRRSIRLRGFAAGFGAIALVISMVAPVSAAGPSPDAATLVANWNGTVSGSMGG